MTAPTWIGRALPGTEPGPRAWRGARWPRGRGPAAWFLLAAVAATASGGCTGTEDPAAAGNDANLLIQSGLRDLQQGRLERAVRNLEQAREQRPDDPVVVRALTWAYLRRGQFERAHVVVNAGLVKWPSDPDLLFTRGTLFRSEGRCEHAIRDFSTVLDPSLGFSTPESAHYQMADSYRCLNRMEEAISSYWSALEVKPYNAVFRTELCETLHEAGREQVAFEQCSHVTKYSPKHGPAHFLLGEILLALGRDSDAMASFRRYLELEPAGEHAGATVQRLKGLGDADPSGTGKRRYEWKLP